MSKPLETKPSRRPHVLVLGGNFAGLGAAQKIRQCAGDAVDVAVTVIRV